MAQESSKLEEEIESWKGFGWALRREDKELWEAMVRELRENYGDAVEKSGMNITTDPFFMALLLAQQRIIRQLREELRGLSIDTPEQQESLTSY